MDHCSLHPSDTIAKHEKCSAIEILLLNIYAMRCLNVMATKDEHPERFGWWISELESLGVNVKKINEFNDLYEMRGLAEIIKRRLYQDYKVLS